MKNSVSIILTLVVLFFSSNAIAQGGAAINHNGAQPDPSATLDVSSTTGGFLMPRMSTGDRNAIQNPAQGLMIFNTSTNCFETFISPMWQTMFCGCTNPATPSSGVHVSTNLDITWNWSASSGATGYKYHTSNDYLGATDIGNVTSYQQTGLECNTAYSLYVWAYNSCGPSEPVVLSQSTLTSCFTCGVDQVTFVYRGGSVSYGTVVGQNGTCWMDRNLGASQVGTAYNDAAAYGDLFQWGRDDDGHQLRNSSTTPVLSSSDSPGHGDFITDNTSPYDWRSPMNDNLWQGVNGVNNPCPEGWRIPTESELSSEHASWSSNNLAGAFSSPLKWVAGGRRSGSNTFVDVHAEGFYRSSTVNGDAARIMWFWNTDARMDNFDRVHGLSVRCIRD